jgi:hypothetical protein
MGTVWRAKRTGPRESAAGSGRVSRVLPGVVPGPRGVAGRASVAINAETSGTRCRRWGAETLAIDRFIRQKRASQAVGMPLPPFDSWGGIVYPATWPAGT